MQEFESRKNNWKAQWITDSRWCLNNWYAEVRPAPMMRRELELPVNAHSAKLYICGLGYYEASINGKKVGDHVLDPLVTEYDKRVRYVTYDVKDHLVKGSNAIGVVLGNGWYNCHTADVWHFDKASWRDYPKLLLQLEVILENGEQIVLCSDTFWKTGDGPIRFDALRNGETYDAREELKGWNMPGFDDEDWLNVKIAAGPGGELHEQISPPCRVMQALKPVSLNVICPGVVVYDLGQNMAGWVQLHVRGDSGTEIKIRYAEKLAENGEADQGNICGFIRNGDFQTDRYIMKGGEAEVWEPRFTYHGFRYVQIEGLPGVPTLDNIRGLVVYTSFDEIGSFECSDEDINKLQECTKWSYVGNFVGIPTDCPHREKNGWTGDAQLAAETGLMNYDASSSYKQWLETMADTQRPSGQFPGIVPSCGWGYNWGSGPAWDSAFVLIPWYIYLYTGDLSAIAQHYEGVKRYVDFCSDMATDNIVSFGLGDWCHIDESHMSPVELTSTSYYYVDTKLLSTFAELTGRKDDAHKYGELAGDIGSALNKRFYKGGGIYANGEMTSLGCALYQGFVEDSERDAVLQRLVEAVNSNDYKVDFGILGAKYVPRVLADNGYADIAFKLISQPEFPGWVNWLRQGSTTLLESWGGESSRNHIMFGDISAWMYQYLAGITPDPENPGFKHLFLKPNIVDELNWVKCSYKSPYGLIKIDWQRKEGQVDFKFDLPVGVTADLVLPDGTKQELSEGHHSFNCGM